MAALHLVHRVGHEREPREQDPPMLNRRQQSGQARQDKFTLGRTLSQKSAHENSGLRADRPTTGRSALSGPTFALRSGDASIRAVSCGKQVAIDDPSGVEGEEEEEKKVEVDGVGGDEDEDEVEEEDEGEDVEEVTVLPLSSQF